MEWTKKEAFLADGGSEEEWVNPLHCCYLYPSDDAKHTTLKCEEDQNAVPAGEKLPWRLGMGA